MHNKLSCSLRSAVFLLWLAVTVVPWATAVLVVSIFVRGDPVYWMCISWLRTAIWGARVICGVSWRVQGMDNLPTAADRTASVILLSKHQSAWEPGGGTSGCERWFEVTRWQVKADPRCTW